MECSQASHCLRTAPQLANVPRTTHPPWDIGGGTCLDPLPHTMPEQLPLAFLGEHVFRQRVAPRYEPPAVSFMSSPGSLGICVSHTGKRTRSPNRTSRGPTTRDPLSAGWRHIIRRIKKSSPKDEENSHPTLFADAIPTRYPPVLICFRFLQQAHHLKPFEIVRPPSNSSNVSPEDVMLETVNTIEPTGQHFCETIDLLVV